MDEYEPVIMDIGSGTLKAGLASDDAPKSNTPMIVGQPKSPGIMVGMEQKDYYFGNECNDLRDRLKISNPVRQGVVQDFDMLELIMKEQIFNNELRISADEHKMLLSEPPNNKKENREKLIQMMIETFDVRQVYLGKQAVLALFATGRTTGTVLDSGEGITHAVPIFEGYALPFAIKTIDVSGADLTDFLHKELMGHSEHQKFINGSWESRQRCEYIKERGCQVAQDFEAELKQAQDGVGLCKEFPLPGSDKLVLREELLRAPEVLFHPNLMDKNQNDYGIARQTHDCIMKCDADIRKDLFKHIVLAGGCTMFLGMKDRMRKEIQALAPSPMAPEVDAPADRKNLCWLGGAILSQISRFDPMYITKKEWDESGPQVVHRKCF